MTAAGSESVPTEWLAMPDLVDLLDVSLGRVRTMIEDRQFVGSRRDGVFKVPSVFFMDGEPISSLRGTIIVLEDAGFSEDELIDWLLAPEESMGEAPINVLRAGRKSEVRRIARSLA